MLKAKIFLIVLTLSNIIHSEASINQEPCAASAIITDIASMTDDIAELIISCKKEKDPQKIKAHVINLIKSIASITEVVIEQRKLKKQNRSIQITNFHTSLDQEIEEIIFTILKKMRDNEH